MLVLQEATGAILCLRVSIGYGPLKKYNLNIDGLIVLPIDRNMQSVIEINLRSVLEVWGIPANFKIIFLYDYAEIQNLYVAEPGRMIDQPPPVDYRDFLRQLAIVPPLFNGPLKILVSRRAFAQNGRLAGMDYLAKQLSMGGYFEFTPERYPYSVNLKYSYLLRK